MIDYFFIDTGSNMSANIITLLSALLGAGIGGFATYKATMQAHKNNIELEEKKNKETEKAVVLSIVEELRVFHEIYYPQMKEGFDQLNKENQYLDSYYIATQDFFTVYTNNADKIGMITDKELRNLIVKIYVFLKKYLEDFNILRIYHEELASNKAVYNELIDVSWRLKEEFEKIKIFYDVIINKVDSTYKE